MTYISRSSSFATTFTSQQTIAEKTEQFRLASDRLNNVRKFPELSDYRRDLSDLLTHNRRIARAEKDESRIDRVLGIVTAYEQTLGTNAGGVGTTGLQSKIQPLLDIVREGLEAGVDTEQWRNRYDASYDNRLRDIQTLLNTSVAGRYIFAGRRYEGAPLRNLVGLAEVPLPSAGTDYNDFLTRNTPDAASNRVADHDRDAADTPTGADGNVVVAARQQSVLQIERNQTIEYGLSSNAAPINNVLLGSRLISRALDSGTSDAHRRVLLLEARTRLENADTDIRELRQGATIVASQLEIAKDRQQDIVLFTQALADRITYFDSNQAGVELSAISQQLNSTLQTIGVRNRLTILSFL